MKKILYLFVAVMFLFACNTATEQGSQETSGSNETEIPAGTTQIAIIDVTGMHCDGCVNTITNALTELEGVESAKVSLEYEQAKVKFDPSKASPEELRAAIEAKAYGVANIEVVENASQSGEGQAK